MRYLISIGALLAGTTFASAADFGGPPAYDGSIKDGPVLVERPRWSGLYFGGHAGWLTGGWDGKMAYREAYQYQLDFDASSKSLDGDGWFGGLQAGFNRQHGAIVWGMEADISWADLDEGKRLWPYPGQTDTAWDINNELDYFGTVRGRL